MLQSSALLSVDELVTLAPPVNNHYSFIGFTAEGIEAFKKLRDAVRHNTRLFNAQFANLEAYYHVLMLTRATESNAFVFGPPGAAKSSTINELFKSENTNVFRLQMNPLLSDAPFTGIQRMDKAMSGEYEVNTQGSIAESERALIDEIEKGSPAALGALLSVLQERQVLAGRLVQTKVKAIFSTSNSNLPQFLQMFTESGQRSTGPALLNRFHFKAYLSNWLPREDKLRLDTLSLQKKHLKMAAKYHPGAQDNAVFAKPMNINWDHMNEFTEFMIEFNDLFLHAAADFEDAFRIESHKTIRESETLHRHDRITEPYVYAPSFESTERLRQHLLNVIRTSAFIDFLLSDLANDEHLTNMKKPIKLGPSSLWRLYTTMTTVVSGNVALVQNTDKELGLNIRFVNTLDESNPRDSLEDWQIQNIKGEQKRFTELLGKHLNAINQQLKVASPFTSLAAVAKQEDFERLLKAQ